MTAVEEPIVSHSEQFPQELQNALAAYGVRQQWDALAEGKRSAVLDWLKGSAPEAALRARVVAQRLSAGLTIEPDELTRDSRRHEVRRRRLHKLRPLPQARWRLTKALLVDSADPATTDAAPVRLWAAGLLPQRRVFPRKDVEDEAAVAIVERQHSSVVAIGEMDFRDRDAHPEILASSTRSDERVIAAALARQSPLDYGFLVVTTQRVGYVSLEPGHLWIKQHALADVSEVRVRYRWTGIRLSIVTTSQEVEYWTLASPDDAYRVALRLSFAQKLCGEANETVRDALRRDVELAIIQGVMSSEEATRARQVLMTPSLG